MTDTPAQDQPVERHPSADRIIAFTDAAVAIALTLLVPPLMESVSSIAEVHESPRFADWFAENSGAVWAFALSFLLVAVYWVRHHAAMLTVRRFAGRMLTANFVWILAIVLAPVTSAVTMSFERDVWSVGVYLGDLAAIGLSLAWIEVEAMRNPEAEAPSDAQWSRLGASIASVLALVVCFVLVTWTPVGWLGMFAMALSGVSPAPVTAVPRRVARRGTAVG